MMFIAYSSDRDSVQWIDGVGETADAAIAEAVEATGADPGVFEARRATPALVEALQGPQGGWVAWSIVGGVADVRS